MAAPLTQDELVKVYTNDTSSKLQNGGEKKVISVGLLDMVLDDKYEPKLIHKNGRLSVVVETDVAGLDRSHADNEPAIVLLDAPKNKLHDSAPDVRGFRPHGISANFPPSPCEQVKDKLKDKPSVIFGGDDRVVFNDQSFPFGVVGKIQTAVAGGSGCMIGPRHVLTASHCVNWAADGSAGWIQFTPGYYESSGPWGTFTASTIYSYKKNPSTLSDDQTAFDYVVLVLDSRIGDTIGYAGTRVFDSSWVNNSAVRWQTIGYPNDLTASERPVFQNGVLITSKQDFTFSGHTGSVLGHFSDVTYGMFGGPLWGTFASEAAPRVVGVCSTREGPPIPFPDGSTNSDNEFGGGQALVDLVSEARNRSP